MFLKLCILFLLICISKASVVPPINHTDTQHDNQKSLPIPETKIEQPKPNQNSDKIKVEPTSPAIKTGPSSPVKDPITPASVVKKFPWLEMRNNKTFLQRFNESLLNVTVVPFLLKCDKVEEKYMVTSAEGADPELNLCPLFFDNLVRLNESSAADSINSSELEAFIKESNNNNKTFCENVFSKNVNSTSMHFKYAKDIHANMVQVCYGLCFEPNIGPFRKTGSCAAIAFMGKKLKKTEVITDYGSTKNEELADGDKLMEEEYQSSNEQKYEDNGTPLAPEENRPEPTVHAEIIDNHGFNPISPNIVVDEPDPNSLKYFAFATFILCVVYFGWHYRSKMLGLIVEGRRSQRGRGGGLRGGRKHTAAYRKLDSNLEEAINSSTSSRSNSQIIY